MEQAQMGFVQPMVPNGGFAVPMVAPQQMHVTIPFQPGMHGFLLQNVIQNAEKCLGINGVRKGCVWFCE